MSDRLENLEQRMAVLEQRFSEAPHPVPQSPLWALDMLRQRLAGTSGGVLFAGAWQPEESGTKGRAPAVEWQYGHSVDDLLERDWGEAASPLAALGHPVRLELLKQVLIGTTATRDLVETAGLGTSGQLHHHLRVLVAAGWLRQRHRGDYEVPGGRLIPLLTIIVAAEDH